jgi:hypothetical protein
MLAVTTSALWLPKLLHTHCHMAKVWKVALVALLRISLFSKLHGPLSVEFHNRRHNLNRFIVARSNLNRKGVAVHAVEKWRKCILVLCLHAFLTSAPDGVEQSLYPRRKPPTPVRFEYEAVWMTGCVWTFDEKNLFCRVSDSGSSTSLP